MYFLLVLIKLFPGCYDWGATGEKKIKKSAISLQRGQFDPKFHVEEDVPHQSFSHG